MVSNYELATLVLQVLVALATFGALFVYHRQLRVMSHQLLSMQEASRAQSGLSLVDFLQEPNVRKARHTVCAVLSQKPMEEWTSDEKDHASRVTANYDVAGALVRSGIAPVDLVAANWGPSIIHCYEVLEPWIDAHRNRLGARATYWSNFKWLYEEAKKVC
ncbi:DUF4760 domain-containing protein [Hydrogenophaga taeniospiralis]